MASDVINMTKEKIFIVYYKVYPLKKFLLDVLKCKYCSKRWKGGGTLCICCSIEIQKAYMTRQRQIESKNYIISIYKYVLEEIRLVGLLPNRVYQTLHGDTIHLFGDFKDKKYIVV